jgi:hypothetical protein
MNLSNINGYNNRSGLIYNHMNGLKQYTLKEKINPISSNVYPKYKNESNVKNLLRTMNDGLKINNKNGNEKIENIPNKDLSDGGFKNKIKVEPQTKPVKLNISKKAQKLASSDITELPIENNQLQPIEKAQLNKYDKFLSNLNDG